MMRTLARWGLGAVAACLFTSCAQTAGVNNTGLVSRVDNDAIRLNEAHTRTINGVITLNILRARDNWPTGYTTLSGITFSPEMETDANLGLSPLGLGNPVNPFGKSSSGLSRTKSSDAKYSVNPFAEKPGASGLYKIEASEELFQRYIDSGWPIEVIFPLFVRRIEIDAPAGTHFNQRTCDVFGNHEFARRLSATFTVAEPEKAALDPKTSEANPACTAAIDAIFLGVSHETAAPIKIARWFYEDASNYQCSSDGICTERNTSQIDPLSVGKSDLTCDRISPDLAAHLVSAPTEPLKDRIQALETSSGKQVKITSSGVLFCKKPKPDKTLFYLGDDGRLRRPFSAHEFRSFNDMIYFLGETIRDGGALPVNNCGGPVPLFQVHKGATPFTDHAVEVSHAGSAYWALKKPDPDISCTKERTGTVLSVLSQILLLNQSPEFLEAPESLLER